MPLKLNHKRNQKYHYSPLRYPGGKTFLFPVFDELIRASDLCDVTYVEPYAGGAGAALALLLLEKVERIVINDLDKSIYSFWRSALFESDRFIERIRTVPVTVAEWKRQKQIHMNRRSSRFDLGFATFFLNRTNRSGILDGGPIGGLDQTGQWKIDARFTKKTLIDRIEQLADYRNRITVLNQDGVDVIRAYVRRPNTFIYIDPPYYDKGADLYLNHYVKSDHRRLARQLNAKADAYWVLTYDNNSEIKTLYQNRNVSGFSLNYNAYESRVGREIMVLSDALS